MAKAKHLQKHPIRYPWDKWFKRASGKTPLVITKGVDFTCQAHSMGMMFRRVAKDRKDIDYVIVKVEDIRVIVEAVFK